MLYKLTDLSVIPLNLVNMLTERMYDVNNLEVSKVALPEGTRGATLKGLGVKKTNKQETVLQKFFAARNMNLILITLRVTL